MLKKDVAKPANEQPLKYAIRICNHKFSRNCSNSKDQGAQ